MPDDSTAPSNPTGLTATGGQGFITLDWTGNTENDLAGYEVYDGYDPSAKVNVRGMYFV